MRVGPFVFRYQRNGATPGQYIDTTQKAGGRRRRPNLGLVCFVLMFVVFLVKDACLFSSCRFSFSLVM